MLTTTEHGRVGLVLVAQKDGSQHVIGLPPHLDLSGVLMKLFCEPGPSFDGRVIVPFSAGIAYKLAAELVIHGDDANSRMYHTLHTHFGDENVDIYTKLTTVLVEITEMSACLEMPKMLEYKDFIIDHALMYYINAVHDRFYSGKLRGKKRYEQAIHETMKQIDKLDGFISLERVEEYRDKIWDEIIKARQQGIDDRYAKRQEQLSRKRKRLGI